MCASVCASLNDACVRWGFFCCFFDYKVWYHLVTGTSCIISIISTLDAAIQCNMLCAFFFKGHFMEKEERWLLNIIKMFPVRFQGYQDGLWHFPVMRCWCQLCYEISCPWAHVIGENMGHKRKICILLSEDLFIYNRVAVFKLIFNIKWIQRP